MKSLKQGKPPLIAHVIYRLDVGGLENGLVNIINGLPEGKYRHVIICLTDYTDFHKKIRPDVQLIALNKKPGHDLKLYWRMFKLFRRLKPDILHTRNLAALEAQVPAWLAGVKHRIHGLHGWDVSAADAVGKKYLKFYQLMDYWIHRYIPLSDELESFLFERVRVNRQKSRKICNGVDTHRFYPRTQDQNDIFPAQFEADQALVIGTVGRLESVKNQLLLVEAFSELIKRDSVVGKDVYLVLVGDGSMRETIERRINELGLTQLVWMTGSRNDIPELMASMDVFVLPSKAEGISNTILEAMASGLAVIATDVGGNSQLVVDNKTGFIAPADEASIMADKLQAYVDNGDLLETHARTGQLRVEKQFSLKHMVDQYDAVYEQLLIR